MKNGMFKKVMFGGKSLTGKTGVIAAIADVAISIVGAVVVGVIGNHFAKKMDDETEAEGTEENDTTEEVEVEPEVVKEETEKKG